MPTHASPSTTLKTPTKRFQKREEDFTCLWCGFFVKGDGYRNHCSYCLLSRHVDVNPGDRAATCGGKMFVADITLEHGQLIIIHECEQCHHQKRNRSHQEDRVDTIVELMRTLKKN